MMMLFWVLAPCRMIGRCQHFGRTYCLHPQPWRWRRYVSPKRWHLPTSLHGARTQNNYRTVILPVVLYGCETQSFTWREEHRLKVYEEGIQRRAFEPKREEVTRGWRKLHNGRIMTRTLQHITGAIKLQRMNWAEHGEMRNAYRMLFEKPEWKKQLGWPWPI
jgi:hypothetical protein